MRRDPGRVVGVRNDLKVGGGWWGLVGWKLEGRNLSNTNAAYKSKTSLSKKIPNQQPLGSFSLPPSQTSILAHHLEKLYTSASQFAVSLKPKREPPLSHPLSPRKLESFPTQNQDFQIKPLLRAKEPPPPATENPTRLVELQIKGK